MYGQSGRRNFKHENEENRLTQQDQEYLDAHETRKRYNDCSNETQKRLNFSSIYDKFFTVQNRYR